MTLVNPEHFIDGGRVKPASGVYFETIDPATEKVIQTVARGNAADIDRAVTAAHRAMQGPWRAITPSERGRLLLKLGEAVAGAVDELALLETRDVGKPLRVSRGEIEGACKAIVYAAGAADKMEGQTIPLGPDFVDFTMMEPIGVTAHIVPWNFPLGLAIRSLAPALAAGCTAVVKPAEQSPLSALRLGDIALEVGFPPGVVNVVAGFGEEAGEALVRHPLVRGITFTGSVATGRRIMAAAAEHIKPLILELGGKNPLLVFADADLERAVGDALLGAFSNAGQVCSSASRFLVQRDALDSFIERLRTAASRLTVGVGDDNPDIGPLVSAEQYDRVTGYIDSGRRAGARIVLGGGRPRNLQRGYFVEPTIFDQVDPSMAIAREEIFGPVAVVIPFDDEAQALSIANGLGYGLVAGVHTRDISRALKLAGRLEAGSVWINGWSMGGVQAPTGGIKDSGIGKERGLAGVRNYLHTKNVAIRL
jgi:aldehyde dehydrogenase (NAD+)